MSRFEKLEFDDGVRRRAGASPEPTGTPVRDAAWHETQARAAWRRQDFEGALRSYSRALEDDPRRVACWVGQIRALVELGEYKEALLWSAKALELFPDHIELLSMQVSAEARSGRIQRALALSDRAMSVQGMTPLVWLVRGEVLLAARRRYADQCLAQAVATATNEVERAWWRIEIARMVRHWRRYALALRYAEPAVETLSAEPGAWLVLGQCRAALGLRGAVEAFERALELDPECTAARLALRRYRPGRLHAWWRRLMGTR